MDPLRACNVKGVCRLLEDSLGADRIVLETTTATQAWAIEHFKTEPPGSARRFHGQGVRDHLEHGTDDENHAS